METLADVITELETFLVWAREHADLPVDSVSLDVSVHQNGKDKVKQKETLAAYARAMGKVQKNASGGTLWINHYFSRVCMTVFADQDAVCVKRVIREEVPATVLPAEPERVIPAHVVEREEWDCGSILAPIEQLEQVGTDAR